MNVQTYINKSEFQNFVKLIKFKIIEVYIALTLVLLILEKLFKYSCISIIVIVN